MEKMILLAIDPGVNTGFALFRNGYLSNCGIQKDIDFFYFANTLVIEKPQIYRGRLQKGDPNDLITLAIQVGRYVERFSRVASRVELVLPATWKGQVPKEIHHPRIMNTLNETERPVIEAVKCAKSLRHNIIDAVGLGIWFLQKEGLRS